MNVLQSFDPCKERSFAIIFHSCLDLNKNHSGKVFSWREELYSTQYKTYSGLICFTIIPGHI